MNNQFHLLKSYFNNFLKDNLEKHLESYSNSRLANKFKGRGGVIFNTYKYSVDYHLKK